jgi:hypothetical protein
MLAGKRELVVGRCTGDHACAHAVANLDGREPDPARGAEHG